MDSQAAKEYHAALLKRLNKRVSALDRLWWIPALGAAGYFTFEGIAGGCLGALIGWGICAVLSKLDSVILEISYVEFLRHLHECTDEAEAGKAMFEFQERLDRAILPWWARR